MKTSDTAIQEERAAWRRERRERRDAVVALRRRALARENLAAVLDDAVDAAVKVMGVEFAKVLAYDGPRDALTIAAVRGWRRELIGHVIEGARDSSQAGYALRAGTALVVEVLRRVPELVPELRGTSLLREQGVVSGATVVIRGQEGPYGVLSVHTTKRRIVTPDEVGFLVAVADVIAAAVYRFGLPGARLD